MLRYAVFDTRIGTLFAAVGSRGVAALQCFTDQEAHLSGLRRRFGVEPLADMDIIRPLIRYVHDYEAGLVPVEPWRPDLRGLPPFTVRALEAARRIPRGRVATYSAVAAAVSTSGAARAVGRAMARNPVLMLVPCHRVVSVAGIGGFSAPMSLKVTLLAADGLAADVASLRRARIGPDALRPT